jgi:hypothetical protein
MHLADGMRLEAHLASPARIRNPDPQPHRWWEEHLAEVDTMLLEAQREHERRVALEQELEAAPHITQLGLGLGLGLEQELEAAPHITPTLTPTPTRRLPGRSVSSRSPTTAT